MVIPSIAPATSPTQTQQPVPQSASQLTDAPVLLSQALSVDDAGVRYYQSGQFSQSIHLWETALSQTANVEDRITLHTNLAKAYQQIGSLEQAIRHWDQVLALVGTDNSQHQGAVLTEQAQIYNQLGQHRRAIDLLTRVTQLPVADPRITAAVQGGLGNAYWALGDYTSALAAYQLSLTHARRSGDSLLLTSALNNLGNLYARQSVRYREQMIAAQTEGEQEEAVQLAQQAQNSRDAALAAYQESLNRADMPATEIAILLNLNDLLAQTEQPDWRTIQRQRDRILQLLATQPDSRDKAYTLVKLAVYPLGSDTITQRRQWLDQARAVARAIGDRRAESFALGALGQLLETTDPTTAMGWTREALFAAQAVNALDSLYRWQWQMGRLLKARGDVDGAIAAYEQAVATLQSIRTDILATNRDLQFNFRDAVEPVYRELIDLLLSRRDRSLAAASKQQVTASNPQLKVDEQQALQKALDVLELLKLAELANFFGDDCVQVAQAQSATSGIPSDTAVVYSVILPQYTEIITRLPDGSLMEYQVPIAANILVNTVGNLRTLLEKRSTEEYLPAAQQLYDLLMRPLEPALRQASVKTLVLINDGVLRKIPIAALHDGQQFLIQKVAIATAPSLSLVNLGSTDLQNRKALILGLTEARPPFAALPNVTQESKTVQSILNGTVLLDQEFTLPRLEQELNQANYAVIHIATHGKFGVDNESTFLLGYDQRITIDQLETLLRRRKGRSPVELLTLSACQTATGDNRSALGIAGVAVRAGVRSAIATLWAINDESTVPLIEEFYRQLRQPGITKAEALRAAQLAMLNDLDWGHPAVWSPFILIGNWL
ncbi:MAG: CHAT domain-containing protein [Cyanobacteria bacterium]|nr:CHAT domain-containing protein [Cyanobacteriota bacterium]MDW8200800.1 CHAT domain-containing protein [Cyanobacteriota bacterium SKYGB_h_bin112]